MLMAILDVSFFFRVESKKLSLKSQEREDTGENKTFFIHLADNVIFYWRNMFGFFDL